MRFPLSGKLQCLHDGCTYIRGNWKLKNCKRVYWGCDTYRRNGKSKTNGCNSPLLYEDELVEAFKPIVKSIFDNKNSILEENTKTSFESVETLRKTIENIISINDDSVLSIASSLFEKIIVETNHEKNGNKKAVLHCQLKIEGDKRYNLPLKELSLLFKSNERFCRTKW